MKTIVARIGRAVAVGTVVLVAGGAAAWLASGSTHTHAAPEVDAKEPDSTNRLRRVGQSEVIVPPALRASLGIKTAPVLRPSHARKLPAFQGTLNFDNNRLARIQSPFTGTIKELMEVRESVPSAMPGSPPAKAQRPIKVGDHVNKGDVLAVVWSKDLGEKKSEFVDAVSKLKTDEETLKRLETLYQENGTAERSVREAERAVKADRVAVERAEATLRSWFVTAEEITALRATVDALSTPNAKRTDPAKWARVEIKAPIGGVVLEKNVAVSQVVDTTADLFRIGDLSSLTVWVHVYEEDLPLLHGLTLPTPWVITATAVPGASFHGRLEMIGASIDPAQHTALVTGTVVNGSGELRAGMAVSVTIELPPATGELEVPAEAVVEDGRESFVFVHVDAPSDRFVRRPVAVARRSRDTIAITERPDGVKPGENVVTSGSLLLGDAFSDLPQTK